MHAVIYPGNIAGQITAPPSKSMTQRAYAAALLHKGTTTIHHAGDSDDEQAALNVILDLGATIISKTTTSITLSSEGIAPVNNHINCGESGLAARLFTPIAALSALPLTINGRGSLTGRPMHGFNDVLTELGVTIGGFEQYLPITLQGPIEAKSITMDATSGSQFVSGLLFALSYAAKEPITLTVNNLNSKPYIDLTMSVLKQFGIPITHTDHRVFFIDPALFTHNQHIDINIEGDWSGSANLLVAGAIAGSVTVHNLQTESTQADRAIMDILVNAGAKVHTDGNSVTVQQSAMHGFEFDATHCPDLFPILAILAGYCNGESTIRGVHRLFHKESNRAESIGEMLQSFDIPYSIEDDMLCIEGGARLQGTMIDPYKDHRIAMAAAIGGLCANTQVDIPDAEAVNKSYTRFFKDLSLCGVKCVINES